MTGIGKATRILLSGVLAAAFVPVTAMAAPQAQAQETYVTIGDGENTNGYIGAYGSSMRRAGMETIYTVDEIGTAGDISSVAFDIAGDEDGRDTSLTTESFKIYLGHTAKAQVSASGHLDTDGLTLVYSGNPTVGANAGWETFEFNQNEGVFKYNGSDNLIVWIVRESGRASNGLLFSKCTPTSNGAAGTIVRGNEGNTDPFESPEDVVGETLVSSTYTATLRPNVRFGIEGTCTHASKKFIDTVEPICMAGGFDAYYCPDCGLDVRTDRTAALGHDMKVASTQAPTCEASGTTTSVCARCGFSETRTGAEKIDHIWDWDDAITTEDGQWQIASCKNCKQKTSKTVVKEAPKWDGSAAAWTEGDGTEANPYKIANGANLAYLAQMVETPGDDEDASAGYAGKHFVMTSDIDLNVIAWTPIGVPSATTSTKKPFMGVFDGAGHSISGLNINVNGANNCGYGLFGTICEATVKNLTLASGSVTISGTSGYAGAIVGQICEKSSQTTTDELIYSVVENCISAVSVEGGGRVGGLVGYLKSRSGLGLYDSACTAEKVCTTATTSSTTYAGGFIGYISGGSVDCQGCYCLASVASRHVGGFVAGGTGGVSPTATYPCPSNVSFKNCYSAGEVTQLGTSGTPAVYKGAFVGNNPTAGQTVTGSFDRCFGVSGVDQMGKTGAYTSTDACGTVPSDLTDASFLASLNEGLDTPAFKAGNAHPQLVWEGAVSSGGDPSMPSGPVASTLTVDDDPVALKTVTATGDNKATSVQSTVLDVAYDGDGKVNVTCSDESVVRANYNVATGKLTMNAVGGGMATVTVSASAGNVFAAPAAVTIPVAVLGVEFMGGSLRTSGQDASQTAMRLGYKLDLPTEGTKWSWGYSVDGIDVPNATVDGANRLSNEDGTITSNIVFTGIPSNRSATGFHAILRAKATDAAGNVFEWEDDAHGRSVEAVAKSIAASPTAAAADKAYARGVLGI